MHRRRFLYSTLGAVALGSALAVSACAPAANPSTTSGSAAGARPAAGGLLTVNVRASNYQMDPSALTIPAGQPIQLVYQNDDTVTHQLSIPDLTAKVLGDRDRAKLGATPSPDQVAAALKAAPDGKVAFVANPGQQVVTAFVAEQAGSFTLECLIPGHQAKGMIAKVEVTPAAQTAAQPTAAATALTMPMGGHQMAPVTAQGQAHVARDPVVPPIPAGDVKQVTFDVSDRTIAISPDAQLGAWTFGGTLPGPVLHVRQGDTIRFTLNNTSTMAHSIDFHADRTAPNVDYKAVPPGQSYTFTWTARDAGVFMYHCGTAPALQHLAEGMYGAVIVDPIDPPLPKVDKEFVFVQSEFYLTDTTGLVTTNMQKANSGNADLVVFNGYANQYADHPIPVKAGEKLRAYLVNAGPNHFSAVHVVGTIFDHVYADGNPQNDLKGIQTWTVAPGEGAAFDFTLGAPGNYPMVSHSFSDANKGAVAVFQAS